MIDTAESAAIIVFVCFGFCFSFSFCGGADAGECGLAPFQHRCGVTELREQKIISPPEVVRENGEVRNNI
jgi:hypothetical protein